MVPDRGRGREEPPPVSHSISRDVSPPQSALAVAGPSPPYIRFFTPVRPPRAVRRGRAPILARFFRRTGRARGLLNKHTAEPRISARRGVTSPDWRIKHLGRVGNCAAGTALHSFALFEPRRRPSVTPLHPDFTISNAYIMGARRPTSPHPPHGRRAPQINRPINFSGRVAPFIGSRAPRPIYKG